MDKEDVAHIYNGTLLNQKKNDIGLFEETWVDLESVIESKVNQKEKNTLYQYIYMESRKMAQMSLFCGCSVAKSYPILFNSVNCSLPDSFVLLYLSEFAQTHIYWVSDAILPSSVALFSSFPHSFPASGSFPMSQLFASGGQSIGASTSVLPMNNYGWFILGLTSLISLLSKELSGVFSSTTIPKHQFFGAQSSLSSNSYSRPRLLKKP